MAVPEQTPYIEHTGNGVTTSFSLKFQCESKDHLIVLVDEIEPPIATWSLTGGNVVFTTAPAAGKKITVQRNTPFGRATNYQSFNNSFRPQTVNKDFDWIWWKLQELGVADWILGNRINALKNYVDRKDDELKAYLMEEIRKQGVALDQLDEYYNYLMQRLAQIAVDKGWDASFVVDGDKNQKQINDEIKAINELQALHNKASAVFTDYLTPNEIANSTTTNLAAKLQDINDTGEISKLRIDRDFYINGPVVFNRDFYFDFDPDANFIFGVNGSIKFEGSAELIGKPAANITKASRTIQITHNGALSPYDLICIYNPTDFSFSPNKFTYRAGEFIEVGTTPNSTSITTAGKPYADYVAEDVDIYKISPITIGFNTFNVKADNTALDNPVTFSFCRGMDLTKYRNFGSKSSGLALDRCFDVSIFASQATNNSSLVGLNYGISIANSQRLNIYGASGIAARHAVSTGGGADICSVPCREINVMDSTLRTSNTASIAAADFHGNAEYCKYINCNIDQFSGGGRNITLENCTIFGRDADGSNIILSDVSGGSLNINNCTLHVNSNMTTSRGIIDITINEGLYEDLVININNLKVKGVNGSAGVGYIVRIATADSVILTNKIAVNVDGVESSLNEHAAIVWIQGGTSQPILPDVEINQSNIITKKKGIYYVHPTTTATAPTTKYSLPTQSGSELITTASEASGVKLGSVITFPYYYPIAPIITHGIGTDGTWTVDSSFSLKPVEVMYSTNTPTQLRFALVSPSALPAKTFKLSYQVGL